MTQTCRTLSALLVSLTILLGVATANAATTKTSGVCVTGRLAATLAVDDNESVTAIETYREAIGALLVQERFTELDCLADEARSGKTRFSGGEWRLHSIYRGLDKPLLHPTQKDWKEHLARLAKWTATNPSSITARVAESEAYSNFAWDARGTGWAESVSSDGWKVYEARAAKARQILESAAKLTNKCPEWFVAMQMVAQEQSWNLDQIKDLLRRGSGFDPTYYYVYTKHANLLLPKWFGEEGETEKFVEEVANRFSGKESDLVYAQLSTSLICKCGEHEFVKRLSWPRIQKGYAAMEEKYGMSYTNLNSLAYIASVNNDSEVAHKMFERIGEQRDDEQWSAQSFKQVKEWAALAGPVDGHHRQMKESAAENGKTPEGVKYSKTLGAKLTDFVSVCKKDANFDGEPFQLTIRVDEKGTFAGALSDPTTPTAICVLNHAYASSLPPAPRKEFWLIFDVNPKEAEVGMHEGK